ncbi:MAG: hypothetical protein Q9160_003733 [Pyrenula sp. 1 TL-2023]
MTSPPPEISTPPATTLTPRSRSPTPEMPPSKPLQYLYLIVATSVHPPLGIGNRGTLPWPSLKHDMAFFSRVTQRTSNAPTGSQNAVIMGRRTWESIPKKFRPLKGRWNLVVSKNLKGEEGCRVVGSVGEALDEITRPKKQDNEDGEADVEVDKVFVIGGAGVYEATMDEAKEESVSVRILQTLIKRKDGDLWECDTYFPVDFDKEQGWRQVRSDEASAWAGEAVSGEWVDGGDKNGEVEIRVQGWEKL